MGTLEPYQELESRYSKILQDSHPYTVACSSGTAALHLAMETLQLPLGAVVGVPEFTMVACARAVTMAGLQPTFIDCTSNLLLDLDKLHHWSFSAMMAVHIYGRLCPMNDIHNIVTVPVVEDMAEAHGCLPHPTTAAVCWSFYRNKIVAGEEGGLVAFKTKAHADFARSLRSLGFTESHNFIHIPRGHNYRMSNLHARTVLDSLELQESNIAARNQVIAMYDQVIPEEWKMPPRQAPWVYDVCLPEDVDVERAVQGLQDLGVRGARCGFKCMSEQPEYQFPFYMMGNPYYQKSMAYKMSRRVLYLPVNPQITATEVSETVSVLKSVVAFFSR